jgi:hypothetical protein
MTAPAAGRKRKGPRRTSRAHPPSGRTQILAAFALLGVIASFAIGLLLDRYTFSLQWPLLVHFQSPLVMSEKSPKDEADAVQIDQQGRHLTAYQQYACRKFGSACRVALAIQRAENPKGACEIYHYNSDGTLDWGYFQINTVHLLRPGLNLRDLLDCRANIDFAYVLYRERGFAPWTTYNSGAYLRFLHEAR